MTRIIIIIIFCITATLNSLVGQYWIDTVEIKGEKPFFNLAYKSDAQYADSLYSSITSFLQSINGSQIQISTPGGLTTLLHRGMGNRHLPILWQGINLQNTLNGSFDMALIPSFLFDDIAFFTTGNPTLTGNNGLAGVLTLNNNTFKMPESKAYIKASSLQNYDAGLVLQKKYSNIGIKLGAQSGYHLNKYDYAYNKKAFQRQSTDFLQNNIVLNANWIINQRQALYVDLWWQHADRVIPQSITSAPVIQNQKDANLRSALTYKYYSESNLWTLTGMYGHEILNFMTPVVDSRAKTDIYTIKASWLNISKLQMQADLQYRADITSPNFFTKTYERKTLSANVFKRFEWTSYFNTDITIRQDMVDVLLQPFSWTMTNNYKKLNWSLSSNYNLPGFNDLYWPTGGNPNLKTEKAFKSELKYTFRWLDVEIKPTMYANLVNNWIQWLPQANGLWSPVNQKKVLARGAEIIFEKTYVLPKNQIKIEADYAFNRTTAIEHYYDQSLKNKQLIYIPIHKTGIKTVLLGKKYRLGLNYQFTSLRYDAPDETNKLKPVHMLNATATLLANKHKIRLDINNLLNQEYNWVRFYPMPGINAEIIYSYQF